jgi:hypothetical protein
MSHLLSKEQENMSTYARAFKWIKGDRELHLMIFTGEVRWVYGYIPETMQKSCGVHDLRKIHSNAKRMLNAFRHVLQKSQKVSITTTTTTTTMSICTPPCINLAPHKLISMKFHNGDFY